MQPPAARKVQVAAQGSARRPHVSVQYCAEALPAPVYFVISAVFHSLGPAFAVLLFHHVNLLAVAWIRIASAALVFAICTKPWRHFVAFRSTDVRLVLSLGASLAAMNVCFYEAINRLPLGTVAAIEFLSPIAISAAGTRTKRNALALTVVIFGIYFLTHLTFNIEAIGYLFAFANCGLFGLYIILAHHAASAGSRLGIERLSAAMAVAFVSVTPIAISRVGPLLVHPMLLLAGFGVGVCSSVVPYVCDQLAMARLSRATFALLLSLLPATASLIGIVVLRQVPHLREITGICLVMLAVGIHRDDGMKQSYEVAHRKSKFETRC